MRHLLTFKLFEEGAAGVAAAVGGSGMGAVATSSPSATPGDAAGATIGSGDIGAGWQPTVSRKDSNELKNSKRRKKQRKQKRKTKRKQRKK